MTKVKVQKKDLEQDILRADSVISVLAKFTVENMDLFIEFVEKQMSKSEISKNGTNEKQNSQTNKVAS